MITQHMPPTFTAMLAAASAAGDPRIARTEAADGEAIAAGHIYVAPGRSSSAVERTARPLRRAAHAGSAGEFLPSLGRSDAAQRSPTLRAGASCAVILTGMGTRRAGRLPRTWSRPAAPSSRRTKPTSVVWGMPGAVALAGLCCAVEPLDRDRADASRALSREERR